ncbi:HFR137Wp [Eremothecium sinecaudum]|uniref:HFR137Wp n=1 Tax=Eremothecium sinecaudum TaxID=45286 RepID=A0A120K2M4_9SACH|nr:HFR137Wp [Eremothecium sinecaudum]AMD21992.1 HFR137Wp [Eremothecium sinecaudum]
MKLQFFGLLTTIIASVFAKQTEQEAGQSIRKIVGNDSNIILSIFSESDAMPVGISVYYVSTDACEGVASDGDPIIVLREGGYLERNFNINKKISLTLTENNGKTPLFSDSAILFGGLSKIEQSEELKKCFLKAHPDAGAWVPGPSNLNQYYRYHISKIFQFAGAGSSSYLGFVDPKYYYTVG